MNQTTRAAGTRLGIGRVADHRAVRGLRLLLELNYARSLDHQLRKGLGRWRVIDARGSQRRVAERGALLRRRARRRAEDARDPLQRHVDLAWLTRRIDWIAVEGVLLRGPPMLRAA